MAEGSITQELRLKNIEEIKNYFIKKIGQYIFMSNNFNDCRN